MLQIDWNTIVKSHEFLVDGMWITLKITGAAIFWGMILGLALALFQRSRFPLLVRFSRSYVTAFRAIPLVMLLLWFFLIVPQLLRTVFNVPRSVDVRLTSAMLAFSLLEASFFCEIIRAGIGSVPKGQFDAAKALGLNSYLVMRFIIFPQAFKAMLPVILTQCIVIFQDTSLVYVIALGDFFTRAATIGERDGSLLQMLLFAGSAYWLISSVFSLAIKCICPGYSRQ